MKSERYFLMHWLELFDVKKWYMVFWTNKRIRKYAMKKYRASSVNPNYARTL